MSAETFNTLEKKVQEIVEAVNLYRLELDELRETKSSNEQEIAQLQEIVSKLEDEKKSFQIERDEWSKKIATLIGKIEAAEVD